MQDKLAANRRARSLAVGAEAPSLLAGLIADVGGNRMTPTHATKRAKRYRYYVSALLADDVALRNALKLSERWLAAPPVEMKSLMRVLMYTYQANKATNANGGLKWIQKAAAIGANATSI